jgi:glutamate--cysteine ligase
MRFLDIFLLHCLLCDSPPDHPDERVAVIENQRRTASRGREPGLTLVREGEEAPLEEWAGEVLGDCGPIAAALDRANGGQAYRDALGAAKKALDHPEITPSARVLETMAHEYGNSFIEFGIARSQANRDAIMALPLAPKVAERFERMARESIAEQKRVEAADMLPFEAFRQVYLAPIRLR